MTGIRSIVGALPATEVTNADLARENPSWRIDRVEELSGIEARRVAAPGETAFDLSTRACESLLEQTGLARESIDAILYCTHDPDHPMPGNAHLMHRWLGLHDRVLAFDYRLACSGFVYGLVLADALARAGVASEILLVTAETQSRRMHPGDRSVRALLGDGAAVTHLSASDETGGRIVAHELCTHGAGFEQIHVPAGGSRRPPGPETGEERVDSSGNVRTAEDIHMDGAELWGFVSSTIPGHVEAFLASRSLTVEEIDLFVFHQASKLILDSLAKAMSIPPQKVFIHMKEVGNLSSASIPFALSAALEQGAIAAGHRVLLCGFGAGISYGSVLVEF